MQNYKYDPESYSDPEISKITSRTSTISYKLNPKKFVSLTHSKTDIDTSTVKLYGAYPVTDSIHLFGALDKNTSTGETNKETTGVTYEVMLLGDDDLHILKKI